MKLLRKEIIKGDLVIDLASITPGSDIALFGAWDYFLTAWSWGRGYPVRAFDEIVKMQFSFAAMIADEPIGFAGLNLTANNDGSNDPVQWFSGWVVAREYQRRGVGRLLHGLCLMQGSAQPLNIRATSETFEMHPFFLENNWRVLQDKETARNEAGQPMYVYEFNKK